MNPDPTHYYRVLVTGANKGIGAAIAAALLERPDTHVLLACRDAARGEAARAALIARDARLSARCSVVALDVTLPASVAAAASSLAAAPPLFALVNNAGLWGAPAATIDTNFRGVLRVTDALLPALVQGGRVVNVSSGMGPMFVAKCAAARQAALTTPAATTSEVARAADAFLAAHEAAAADGGAALAALGYPPADADGTAAYGASKALLNLLTLTLAWQLGPRARVTACSPGFIDTDMTQRFFSADRTPAQAGAQPPAAATRVVLHLLFGGDDVASGGYYGSDAKRSPLDRYRAPGEPEYAPAE